MHTKLNNSFNIDFQLANKSHLQKFDLLSQTCSVSYPPTLLLAFFTFKDTFQCLKTIINNIIKTAGTLLQRLYLTTWGTISLRFASAP